MSDESNVLETCDTLRTPYDLNGIGPGCWASDFHLIELKITFVFNIIFQCLFSCFTLIAQPRYGLVETEWGPKKMANRKKNRNKNRLVASSRRNNLMCTKTLRATQTEFLFSFTITTMWETYLFTDCKRHCHFCIDKSGIVHLLRTVHLTRDEMVCVVPWIKMSTNKYKATKTENIFSVHIFNLKWLWTTQSLNRSNKRRNYILWQQFSHLQQFWNSQ